MNLSNERRLVFLALFLIFQLFTASGGIDENLLPLA